MSAAVAEADASPFASLRAAGLDCPTTRSTYSEETAPVLTQDIDTFALGEHVIRLPGDDGTMLHLRVTPSGSAFQRTGDCGSATEREVRVQVVDSPDAGRPWQSTSWIATSPDECWMSVEIDAEPWLVNLKRSEEASAQRAE